MLVPALTAPELECRWTCTLTNMALDQEQGKHPPSQNTRGKNSTAPLPGAVGQVCSYAEACGAENNKTYLNCVKDCSVAATGLLPSLPPHKVEHVSCNKTGESSHASVDAARDQ